MNLYSYSDLIKIYISMVFHVPLPWLRPIVDSVVKGEVICSVVTQPCLH